MSKFFFKGRIDPRQNHQNFGYNNKRQNKPGTANSPLSLRVATQARLEEIEALLAKQGLIADIEFNAEAEENIIELDVLLNPPNTHTAASAPKRNDPCPCGSSKKYKKCCGQ